MTDSNGIIVYYRRIGLKNEPLRVSPHASRRSPVLEVLSQGRSRPRKGHNDAISQIACNRALAPVCTVGSNMVLVNLGAILQL